MMTSEFSIANSSSVWSDSRCVSGSRSLHKCTSDVAEDKTKSFRESPQPLGMEDTSLQLHGHGIRGCAIGQSVVFLLPCSVSVTNQWLTCTQAHWEIAQDKTEWLETSKARGIRRKAGRPNVLWAKIYIQRESTWEWLRSPIILLRATHNQSHVHIRDLKQTAGATSTPRSWMQRPGESTSPWPAKFQRHLLSLLVKKQGGRNYWKTSYWDVTAMSYWVQSNCTQTVD